MGQPRVLVYAQDPGGANLIAPIVKALCDRAPREAVVVSHPLAEGAFRRAGLAAEPAAAHLPSLPADDADIDAWLARVAPSHVICSASSRHVDLTNARLIAGARRRGVPSLTFLDHWVGFDRFTDDAGAPAYLPDVVGVPDRYCQDRVVALGADRANAPIVGHAHLEALAARPRPDAAAGVARLLLVSQPVVQDRSFRGALFLEDRGERAVDRIAEALDPLVAAGRVCLAYRAHPKERGDETLPAGVAIDAEEGGAALFDRHDVFIGVTSMVLFEAAVAGRAVVQLDVPAARGAVAGDWPPYEAGARVASIDDLRAAVEAALADTSNPQRPAGVPGLALQGSLDRSVTLCESFLS